MTESRWFRTRAASLSPAVASLSTSWNVRLPGTIDKDSVLVWTIVFRQVACAYQCVAVRRLAVQRGCCITLRIHVDQQRTLAGHRQGSRKIDGGGSLAHASLLINHAKDPSHGERSLMKATSLLGHD